jgi:RNA polymerase sigma-70 factor (ECF subfamily)
MTTPPLDETTLLRRARAGDTQAFGALVLAHQTFAYNLALRALQNHQEAQDLTQEAFLRAWQGLPAFRGDSGFRTWLYRILMNLCYNRSPQIRRDLAQLAHNEEAEEWLPGESPNPEREFETGERRAFLQRQIETLPASQRVLVLLRYQQDLSYEEIAQATSMPLGTVKTGLFRAHARLKASLSASDNAGDCFVAKDTHASLSASAPTKKSGNVDVVASDLCEATAPTKVGGCFVAKDAPRNDSNSAGFLTKEEHSDSEITRNEINFEVCHVHDQ